MTEMKNVGRNATNVLLGQVVSLERSEMDNAAVDRCRRISYGRNYKYDPDTLPRFFDVTRFNEYDKSDEKEVKILQNAVRCLNAMWLGVEDTSILDEYVDDTLLTFDYDTGKILFDEETFQKDLDEHKNKQRALIDEYNKIVATTTLLNAIENAEKLKQIKDKITKLQTAQPKKDDAKYNHPEIVKGSTSVKQALDRYKELCDLGKKCEQEWEQYEIDYKRSRAKKLSISEDTFRMCKELYNDGAFPTGNKVCGAVASYESVKDFNENSWKQVSFDRREESRKFLNQKQPKLWKKYGGYIIVHSEPEVTDWMMYEYFNDSDLKWLKALKAFIERVTALKRIEENSSK